MSVDLASCNIGSSPKKFWISTQRQGLSSHFFPSILWKFFHLEKYHLASAPDWHRGSGGFSHGSAHASKNVVQFSRHDIVAFLCASKTHKMREVTQNLIPVLVWDGTLSALKASTNIGFQILGVECAERTTSEVYYKQIWHLSLWSWYIHFSC